VPLNANAAGFQGVLNAAGNAAISNLASQGVGIITGQQKGFSWSSVAVSAVGGAVGSYVGGKLDAKFPSLNSNGAPNLTNNIIKGVASGIAGNVASQLTQIAIDGRGRLNWTSVAVSGIYGVGSGLEANRRLEAQRVAMGNTTTLNGNSNSGNQVGGSVNVFNRQARTGVVIDNPPEAWDSVGQYNPNGLSAGVSTADEQGVRFTRDQFGSQEDFNNYNARNGGLNAVMLGVPKDVADGGNAAQKAVADRKTAKSTDALAIAMAQNKFAQLASSVGEDGLRVGPTIERSNLRKNTYSSDIGTIRAERPNIVRDNPIIMSPVRIAGDLVSYFRDDGINPATERPRSTKPYAGLTLAVEAITTFGPLVELRGLMGAGKVSIGANKVVMRSPSELMGVEPASSELLTAIGNKRALTIATAGSEELRMLDYFGAEASVGGVKNSSIILRQNPSKAAALEEFLHGTQSHLGIVDRLGTSGLGSAETHVKDFMIRHQSMLGLSAEDVRILQVLRDKGL
jgi:hypothetical protein